MCFKFQSRETSLPHRALMADLSLALILDINDHASLWPTGHPLMVTECSNLTVGQQVSHGPSTSVTKSFGVRALVSRRARGRQS